MSRGLTKSSLLYVGLSLGLVFLSCKPDGPAATAPKQPAASRSADAPPHDWVAYPAVVASERQNPCQRLLSAAPNITEICCALGLADCLVGRTRYCHYPPQIAAVPSIGALNDLNSEALLQLRPDLVLVAGTSRAIVERLVRLNVRLECLPDATLDDLYASIERIGALTGRSETAARLKAGIRGDLEAVAARCVVGPRRRVLVVLGAMPQPPAAVHAAGPGSFYDDLLRAAGHVNAAADADRAFAPLSLEFILQADPDVIVEVLGDPLGRAGGDADARAAWARLGPLRAVAEGRVHVLVGEQHFILGPRVAQTLQALCKIIGGEAGD